MGPTPSLLRGAPTRVYRDPYEGRRPGLDVPSDSHFTRVLIGVCLLGVAVWIGVILFVVVVW